MDWSCNPNYCSEATEGTAQIVYVNSNGQVPPSKRYHCGVPCRQPNTDVGTESTYSGSASSRASSPGFNLLGADDLPVVGWPQQPQLRRPRMATDPCSPPPAVGIRPWSWRDGPGAQFDSDALQISPGDVLCVRGEDRISAIGAVGGFMGHVLVAMSLPRPVSWFGSEADDLRCLWPHRDISLVWRLTTMESSRRNRGLHLTEMLLQQDCGGQLRLIGENRQNSEYIEYDDPVEVWQAPAELRAQFRMDIMVQVVEDMKVNEASWSLSTAARALFLLAGVGGRTDRSAVLQELQDCWMKEPICTSVVITFWQRYLCKLSAITLQDPADLVIKWMPLKADRALPGELLGTMLRVGWTMLDARSGTSDRGRLPSI